MRVPVYIVPKKRILVEIFNRDYHPIYLGFKLGKILFCVSRTWKYFWVQAKIPAF